MGTDLLFRPVLQTNGDVQDHAALPQHDAHGPLHARVRHENFLLWIPGKSETNERRVMLGTAKSGSTCLDVGLTGQNRF